MFRIAYHIHADVFEWTMLGQSKALFQNETSASTPSKSWLGYQIGNTGIHLIEINLRSKQCHISYRLHAGLDSRCVPVDVRTTKFRNLAKGFSYILTGVFPLNVQKMTLYMTITHALPINVNNQTMLKPFNPNLPAPELVPGSRTTGHSSKSPK